MKIAKLAILLAALLLGGVTLSACGAAKQQGDAEEVLMVCDDCGEVKNMPACCEDGAEICRDCGLHIGSPGCCIIEKGGGDMALCDDCGQIKDAKGCCDPSSKRCPDCGRIKRSPGCCK